ncbi:NB-ARC domain-containing protein [Nocardia sp. NPDC050710]|uniref:NB-ARC domain-containing protein n=1 Tax=Nocardia sp. NPDC050710 TaxID=3157220 RepID=UPI0033C61544
MPPQTADWEEVARALAVSISHLEVGRDVTITLNITVQQFITQHVVPELARSGKRAPAMIIGRIPSEPHRGFVQRDELRYLHELAEDAVGSTVILQGMGGIGKTSIAAAYARATVSLPHCAWVGWIDAGSPYSLLSGLAEVAQRLKVADPDDDLRRAARLLRVHLSGRSESALLVFDDVVDIDLLDEYLPSNSGTHVVITSRKADMDFSRRSVRSIHVGGLTPTQSIQLLHTATNHQTTPPDDDGATRVSAELGHSPLALSLAAGLITEQYLSYDDLLRLLKESKDFDFEKSAKFYIRKGIEQVEAPLTTPTWMQQ